MIKMAVKIDRLIHVPNGVGGKPEDLDSHSACGGGQMLSNARRFQENKREGKNRHWKMKYDTGVQDFPLGVAIPTQRFRL